MIKFPWVFRVFAFVNILAFMLLVIQSIIFYYFPHIRLEIQAMSVAAAIYVLITAFMWFFGSRKSYDFLYTNIIIFLTLTGSALYLSVNVLSKELKVDNSVIVIVYALPHVVYAIFLSSSLFFKPVVEWKKLYPSLSYLPFLLLLLISSISYAGAYYVNEEHKRFIVIDDIGPTPWLTNSSAIRPQVVQELSLDLEYQSEFDGIIISNNNIDENIVALISYASDWDTEQYFRHDTVMFKPLSQDVLRKGEYLPNAGFYHEANTLFSTIPPVIARKIKVVAFNGATFQPSIVRFSLVHSVRHFDYTTTKETFILDKAERPHTVAIDPIPPIRFEASTKVNQDFKALGPEIRGRLLYSILDHLIENYDNPYQYSFNTSSPRITIEGKSFGLYKNFHDAVESFIGPELNKLYYYINSDPEREELTFAEAVEEFSGVSLAQDESSLPFTAINPAFIEWLSLYMLPDADELFYDVTVRQIYKGMFRRNIWLLLATHEYLTLRTDFASEVKDYRSQFEKEDFNGAYYLNEKYSNVSSNLSFEKLYNEFPIRDDEEFHFNEDVAIGFWLRRKLDGTDDEIWDLLREIAMKYDQYPFEESGNY